MAQNEEYKFDHRKVSIVYFGTDDETLANVHLIDSTLGGMFLNVEIIEFTQLNSEKIKNSDILVFYSVKKTTTNTFEVFTEFDGIVLGIGQGAINLPQFENWTYSGMTTVYAVDNKHLTFPLNIVKVNPPEKSVIVETGRGVHSEYPLIISEGSNHFININNLNSDLKYVFSKSLYTLFQLQEPDYHPAYLRLEDISPASDPELVFSTGMYLLNKGIPVYLAVIPVYTNPETGEKITFDDTPKLKSVLNELVEHGAYVISHGFTHTFRISETGEGFEFWDSIMNQHVTELDQEEQVVQLKKKDAFSNEQEYGEYFQSVEEYEKEYTKERLESSIHALTKLGIPPIAFEAPHYTMSSNGYKVTSNYFTALFGQIQASDNNWEVMISPLFISKPNILNGMKLYPETIGFVDPQIEDPIAEIERNLQDVLEVPGAVVGGFYHPYLGLDYLEEFVGLLEDIPNLKWIDLAQEYHRVQTNYVHIDLPGNGQIVVKDNIPKEINFKDYLKERPIEVVLWGIVIITSIFVVLFSIHILNLRIQFRRRIFKERD